MGKRVWEKEIGVLLRQLLNGGFYADINAREPHEHLPITSSIANTNTIKGKIRCSSVIHVDANS